MHRCVGRQAAGRGSETAVGGAPGFSGGQRRPPLLLAGLFAELLSASRLKCPGRSFHWPDNALAIMFAASLPAGGSMACFAPSAFSWAPPPINEELLHMPVFSDLLFFDG